MPFAQVATTLQLRQPRDPVWPGGNFGISNSPAASMSEAMKKDVQEAFEKALAVFEKRQDAEHQRFREREKFETEWNRIRTVVVVPALEDQSAIEQGGVAV
jgi:hypothetical protein